MDEDTKPTGEEQPTGLANELRKEIEGKYQADIEKRDKEHEELRRQYEKDTGTLKGQVRTLQGQVESFRSYEQRPYGQGYQQQPIAQQQESAPDIDKRVQMQEAELRQMRFDTWVNRSYQADLTSPELRELVLIESYKAAAELEDRGVDALSRDNEQRLFDETWKRLSGNKLFQAYSAQAKADQQQAGAAEKPKAATEVTATGAAGGRAAEAATPPDEREEARARVRKQLGELYTPDGYRKIKQ